MAPYKARHTPRPPPPSFHRRLALVNFSKVSSPHKHTHTHTHATHTHTHNSPISILYTILLCTVVVQSFENLHAAQTQKWHRAQPYAHQLQHTATNCNTPQPTATHCNQLQHTAKYCNTLQPTATHCNTLHQPQHTATNRNTLQHTATHTQMEASHTPHPPLPPSLHPRLTLINFSKVISPINI